MRPDVSVVIPMHNEAENATDTLDAVAAALRGEGWSFELVPVNDGSADTTADILRERAQADADVRPVSYTVNRGRGYALRRGFAAARGEIVVSLDADLSYTPDHAVRMVHMLRDDPELDIVVGSPYMSGGAVEGVSFVRLALSRLGNIVLRFALSQPIRTSTGILRAYRRGILGSMDLEAEGKEIHLEILSKALALGYRIAEMPATLRSRRRGKSKFRFNATVVSHLLFSVLQRPATIFGIVGMLLILAGVVIAGFLLSVYLHGDLNPERPLMTVMVLLFLGGMVGLSLAIMALQTLEMRRTIVRLQRDVRSLRMAEDDAGSESGCDA